jgi:transposase-like protein
MSEGVTMTKRPRRAFTDEFKAKRCGLSERAGSRSVRRADDATAGGPLTKADRDEVQRLRREVRVLRMERDILRNSARAKGGPTCGPETPESTLTGPGLWPSAFW